MKKTMLQTLIGDLEEKRTYRRMVRRVNALPKAHRAAYQKLRQYLYCFGACDLTLLTDLLELFEGNPDQAVSSLIGDDAAAFCDELIHVHGNAGTTAEALNREIQAYFHQRRADA